MDKRSIFALDASVFVGHSRSAPADQRHFTEERNGGFPDFRRVAQRACGLWHGVFKLRRLGADARRAGPNKVGIPASAAASGDESSAGRARAGTVLRSADFGVG